MSLSSLIENPLMVGLWSALIGVLAGIFSTYANLRLARNSSDQEARTRQKREAYHQLLRHIIIATNQAYSLDANEKSYPTPQSSIDFFKEIAEIKIWALISSMYASEKAKADFKQINNHLFALDEYVLIKSNTQAAVGDMKIEISEYDVNPERQRVPNKPLNVTELKNLFQRIIKVVREDI